MCKQTLPSASSPSLLTSTRTACNSAQVKWQSPAQERKGDAFHLQAAHARLAQALQLCKLQPGHKLTYKRHLRELGLLKCCLSFHADYVMPLTIKLSQAPSPRYVMQPRAPAKAQCLNICLLALQRNPPAITSGHKHLLELAAREVSQGPKQKPSSGARSWVGGTHPWEETLLSRDTRSWQGGKSSTGVCDILLLFDARARGRNLCPEQGDGQHWCMHWAEISKKRCLPIKKEMLAAPCPTRWEPGILVALGGT